MSNVEKELVLRGVINGTSKGLTELPYEILNQYETHQHVDDGMITNRCREKAMVMHGETGTSVCSSATKYVYSKTDEGKESVELEKDISMDEFKIIGSMLEEHIIKKRYTLEQQGYNIEIDVFMDLKTLQYTDGFKIDIEGDVQPDQATLNEQLQAAGFIVTEWLDPKAWGERYDALVRTYATEEKETVE